MSVNFNKQCLLFDPLVYHGMMDIKKFGRSSDRAFLLVCYYIKFVLDGVRFANFSHLINHDIFASKIGTHAMYSHVTIITSLYIGNNSRASCVHCFN